MTKLEKASSWFTNSLWGDVRENPQITLEYGQMLVYEIERLSDIMSPPKINVHIDGMELIREELKRLDEKIDSYRNLLEDK
jgi:hypothetical protein